MPLTLHTDNSCIRPVSDAELNVLYARLMSPARMNKQARELIRKRVSLHRQHRSGTHLHSLIVARDVVMKESPLPRISASGN